MITIGSLFSGIGSLELGLERAGLGPVKWQVEINPYAQRVLARHWPNAERHQDVRACGRHNLASVELVCGGFPCQDISTAGRAGQAGVGLAGKQSGLWFEFERVLRELRPRFVLVENVTSLLRRELGVVLGGLATLGYDAEWDCIPAQAVGACHRRDRVFIVAYATGFGREVFTSLRQRLETTRAVANISHPRLGRPFPPGSDDALWSSVGTADQPAVRGMAHGVASRVDRVRCVGNAVVPQVTEVIGRCLVDVI